MPSAKLISIIFWPIISSIGPELSILSLRYCCFPIQSWPNLHYICASGPSFKTKLCFLLLNHYPINFSSWFKVVSELLNLFCKNVWFCSSILRQILAYDFFFLLSHKKWRPLLFRYLIALRWSLYGGNEKEKHITLLVVEDKSYFSIFILQFYFRTKLGDLTLFCPSCKVFSPYR